MSKLLSTPSLVEVPYIELKIGDYTFGKYTSSVKGNTRTTTFPEYLQSIDITKYDGNINKYTIKLVYPISPGSDPNLIDKILSTVSGTRIITVSYGDMNSPSFIFQEEEVLISNVDSSVNFTTPQISYTITGVSSSLELMGTKISKPAYTQPIQPSQLILDLLKDQTNGLTKIFTGMTDIQKVIANGLIDTTDDVVTIAAQVNTDVLSYLSYLVSCMVPQGGLSGFYKLSIVDDNLNSMGGSYFTVKRLSTTNISVFDGQTTNSSLSADCYEIDIGYPQNNLIQDFSLSDSKDWQLLYETSTTAQVNNYQYRIDNSGNLQTTYAPSVMKSSQNIVVTSSDLAWWSQVTEFPLTATIKFRGLVRPSTLLGSIKLNVVFFGRRHTASGYYSITKEEDSISSNGYVTTLTLLRTSGDEEFVNEQTEIIRQAQQSKRIDNAHKKLEGMISNMNSLLGR